jgi:uncharacterized RmlC-like cupin family protein
MNIVIGDITPKEMLAGRQQESTPTGIGSWRWRGNNGTRQSARVKKEEARCRTAFSTDEWLGFARRTHLQEKALFMDWSKNGVKIVHAAEMDMNTPQTSGMTRAAAITHAKAGAATLWAGIMVVQPDAKTGPHHHGELETVLYVVKGRVRMRWGDRLELSDEAGAGDFIYVPPYVPHQEINADPNKTCEAVVVRNGQEPVVVNLDLQTPEPASAGHRGMPFHPER